MSEERIEEIPDYRSPLRDALGRPIPLEGDLRVWLDDELVKREAPEGWVHVRTAREACLLLLTGRVVELSLDNDLGDSRLVDEDGQFIPDPYKLEGHVEFGEGRQVVSFLEELHGAEGRALWPSERINLHTSNPEGRDAMKLAIENLSRRLPVTVEDVSTGSRPKYVVRVAEGGGS